MEKITPDSARTIAQQGSIQSVRDLLKTYGQQQNYVEAIVAGINDNYSDREEKMAVVAEYTAAGKNLDRLQLKTIRQLAFNGVSEKVAELLKAQADNPAAISAIVKGVKQDHNRLFRKETEQDRERRSEKNKVIEEFFSKSGRFADPGSEQQRIAALQRATVAELSEALSTKMGAALSQKP